MPPTAPFTMTIIVTITHSCIPAQALYHAMQVARAATSLPCVCAKCSRRLYNHLHNSTTITGIAITSSVPTQFQPLFGPSAAPAIAVLHFIGTSPPSPLSPPPPLIPPPPSGESPAFTHACPCIPSASPPPSSHDASSVPSRCGRGSDGFPLLCAASLSHAMRFLSLPPATTPDAPFLPPSLPHALSRYLSSLQQPQHSLRLRALFRSTFLYHASKAKCLAVPDAVVLLQYAARVVDCSGSLT